MTLLTRIRSDRDLMAQLDLERLAFAKSLRRRADIFTYEADRCGLSYVPYKGASSFPSRLRNQLPSARPWKTTWSLPAPWLRASASASAPSRKSRCKAWPLS